MFPFIRKCFLFVLLVAALCSKGQSTVSGNKQEVSAGLSVPLSNFNETHIAGAGLQYSISNHRFGITKPASIIGWIGSAGVDFFLGKKDKEAGYSFKNGNYVHSRLLGGIITNPTTTSQVSLQSGVGWGVYQGTHAINFCTQLNGTYYLDEQWGVAVKLLMIKEKGAQILWAPGISISRTF